MRIFTFIVSVILTTLILTSGVLLLILASPQADPGVVLVMSTGLSLISIAPILIGSFLAYWGEHPSDEAAQRYQRRGFRIVLGAQTLGFATLIFGAILGHVAIWYAPVMTVVGVVMTVLAVVVGRALYSYDLRHPAAPSSDVDLSRAAHAKRIRMIAVVFFAALITGFVLVLVLQQLDPRPFRDPWVFVSYPIVIACFAGAFTTIFTSLRLSGRMREAAGRDFGSARRISRVVVQGKDEALNDIDLVGAARYAQFAAAYYRYQLAYFSLLYAGLLGQQLIQYAQGLSTLGLYLGVALVVVFVVVLPILIRQLRRTSLYAAEHQTPIGPAE